MLQGYVGVLLDPENHGLEDVFRFPGGPYSQVPC